ncbi:sugar ABC transporter permease [Rhodobacteraceae bacterium]|nr:sugar ABC transporter permease [Paracoccaceae bacterium]
MSSVEMPPQLPSRNTRKHQFPTGRVVLALVLREMSSRYGRSPGGYLWALLEPLGGIFILTLAFSLMARTPPLGTSFILYYTTGFVPFSLYMTLSNTVARSLTFSKPLLTYPAVTWVDALMARFFLNSLTGIMVSYIIFAIVLLATGLRPNLDIGKVLQSTALTLLLGVSLGTLNCALIGLIKIWDQVWSIAMRPLFLMSGVIFLYDTLPQKVQDILWYNPVLHVVSLMHMGFYPTYHPQHISPLYVVFFSLICLTLGLILLRRWHRDILSN